ncbi:hypothetical protein D3C80_1467240 [compost metagenome]
MMGQPPANPKIYHIVNVDRLSSILQCGHIYSDAEVIRLGLAGTNIGMNTIKQRRLQLPVKCHPGITVGQCVPFYFCPRSVMLYVIHRRDNPELLYKGGQEPIVHLEADLTKVIGAAQAINRRWAFTTSNAGAVYTDFYSDFGRLNEINWTAVNAVQWSQADIKEAKQSEFLLHTSFPWNFVERIVTYSESTASAVARVLHNAAHRPPVEIKKQWYY